MVTSGLACVGTHAFTNYAHNQEAGASHLRREVWIPGILQMDFHILTPQLMVDEKIRIVKDVVVYQRILYVCL